MKKVLGVLALLIMAFQLEAQVLAMHNEPTTQQSSVQELQASQIAYQWGIGLRVGEPTGLTVKRFLGSRAFELNIGRSGMMAYNAKRAFDHDNDFDDYVYLNSHLHSSVSLQLHYLSFKAIPIDGSDDLSWYIGLGGQFRSTSIDYRYRYWNNNDRRERWESVTNIDFGADFVGGIDYTFNDVPLSLFADITLFVELLDDPLYLRLQGGGGIRYNF